MRVRRNQCHYCGDQWNTPEQLANCRHDAGPLPEYRPGGEHYRKLRRTAVAPGLAAMLCPKCRVGMLDRDQESAARALVALGYNLIDASTLRHDTYVSLADAHANQK